MLRAWRRGSAEHNKVHLIRPEQANAVNILLEFLELILSARILQKILKGFQLEKTIDCRISSTKSPQDFHCHLLLYQNSDWTSAICVFLFILLHFNFGFSG
jgi:hypothetical protein